MAPKASKKRESEASEAPASTDNLRRSTRGGGHVAPPPKPKSAPRSSNKKAKTEAADGKAEEQTKSTSEDTAANGGGEAAAPATTSEAAVPAEPTKDGIVEGLGNEENGVAIPESNKEVAAAAETKTEEGSISTKRIEIGETIPEGIVLKTDKDEDVSVSDLTKEKGAIFFVYPKANTPGCTTQACNFRDSYADFGPLGYDVYGLSSDSPKAQASWKAKHNFPYTLLCDPGQILLKLLGAAKSAKSNQRSHYIVAKGGKLVDAKYTISPKDSHTSALEFIKNHKE